MVTDTGNGQRELNIDQSEKSISPPYISYLSFKNFIQWLDDEGVPLRFDRSSWDKKYSGSTGPQLMNGLRFLGLLDGENPEPELERLVGAKGEDRKAILRDIYRQRYVAIQFDALSRATTGMLREWFNSYGIEGDTVRKAESFFINAAKDADVPMSAALRKMARNRAAHSGGGAKRQRSSSPRQRKSEETPGAQQVSSTKSSGEPQANVATVSLDSGGEVSLALSVDLFALSQRDRKFVMGLVDQVRGYREESKSGDANDSANVSREDEPAKSTE